MIDRIKISKEIMIGGLKMWLGAEATVATGEDPLKEMHKAEDTLNNYVSVRHGIGESYSVPLYPEPSKISNQELEVEWVSMESAINGCKTLDELKSLRMLIEKSYPQHKVLYNQKLKELGG